jgi:hypothetical protein
LLYRDNPDADTQAISLAIDNMPRRIVVQDEEAINHFESASPLLDLLTISAFEREGHAFPIVNISTLATLAFSQYVANLLQSEVDQNELTPFTDTADKHQHKRISP